MPSDNLTALWVPVHRNTFSGSCFGKSQQFDAIVCLGAVIRGETGRYDYVCAQVSEGCAQVMHDFELPMVFGVLTTENKAQALARSGGDHSDVGARSIDAALEMVTLLEQVVEYLVDHNRSLYHDQGIVGLV